MSADLSKPARKIALSSVLIAAALALSFMERFIPVAALIPLPGVKLGLANIVTIFALFFLGPLPAAGILAVRCLLGSLFSGGATALALSLSGGTLALLTMAVLRRLCPRVLSLFGISIAGAAAHNLGQILAAGLLLKSVNVAAYLPALLLAALLTGAAIAALSIPLFNALHAAGLSGSTGRRSL